jgi:hypothetical protein
MATNPFTSAQAGPSYMGGQALTNPEIIALDRQRKMAEMLLKRGMQGQPDSEMVSGYYVAPSWAQRLSPVLDQVLGQQGLKDVDEKTAKLAEMLRGRNQEQTQGVLNAILGTPARSEEMAGPAFNGVAPTMQFPAVESNPQEALRLAMMSESPEARALLPAIMERALPKTEKPTTEIQNYQFAKAQGFKGTFNDFKNQVTPYEQQRLSLDREKFEFDKSQKGAGKDLTESQGKASAFQSQMVSASNAVNTLEGQGFDPTSFKSQTAVKLAGGAANPLIPVAAQQYKQAQDQWSEAYLRFKTGAAATEPEVVRNNRTFFPVFGDKPEQIAQKAAAREQAERDIGIAAGRGANLGAQAIGQQPRQATPTAGLPTQSAIDAEIKRRGLK